jgi:hypothetical protein
MQSIHIVPRFCDSQPSTSSDTTLDLAGALFMEGVMRDISNCEKIEKLEAELQLKNELIEKLNQQLKELQEKN